MNLIDCHNHSSFSFDAKDSIKEMCQKAQSLNLSAFAITDHCECNFFQRDKCNVMIPQSIAQINELKTDFPKIKIIAGVELGQALQNKDNANEISAINGLDFIIGSLHNAKGNDDFYDLDFSQELSVIKQFYHNYYCELYEMAKQADFDVLGHYEYPIRYFFKAVKEGIISENSIDFSQFDELIFNTFKACIERGKGIEINTSKLHLKNGGELLCMKYLKKYKELGGEYLSIGSDAHETGAVARNLIEAHNIAFDIGFKYITYYENRKPILLPIETKN